MAWSTPPDKSAGDQFTEAMWDDYVKGNTEHLYNSIQRLALVTATSNASANTTFATAANVFSTDATFTADGTSAYVVEVCIPLAETGAVAGAFMDIKLRGNSNADLGILARISRPTTTQAQSGNVYAKVFYTPSAGSTSLNVRGVCSSGGTMYGSLGFAMTLAVYGPETT